MFYDMLGMLWFKVENENLGYCLGVIGVICDIVIDYEEVVSYIVEYLLYVYLEFLKSCYKIDELLEFDWEFVEMVGKKCGCICGGN